MNYSPSSRGPHISNEGCNWPHTAGRAGWPKMRQRCASSSCTQRTPAGLPDPDLASDMLDLITAKTGQHGLQRYEVSAYAQAGHRCQHNTNYWQFGDYLGVGAGAHSKLSFPNRVLRQVRWREPAAYMAQATKVSNEHEVARKDLPFEFMMNALRLREGFEVALFEERTGLPIVAAERGLNAAESKGLLVRDARRISATETGRRFLNDLLQLFLPR